MSKTLKLLFVLLSLNFSSRAGNIDFRNGNLLIGNFVDVLEDKNNNFSFKEVQTSADFTKSRSETPNFGVSKSAYWLRFAITNNSKSNNLLLQIEYPMLESASLYTASDSVQSILEKNTFEKRAISHQDLIFKLEIPVGSSKVYFLKVKGNEQIVIPLILSEPQAFTEISLTKEIIAGIHIGILLVMILYNLFVYLSIKDKSYLYYVLYILSIGLTQTAITGYTFKYLWPNAPYFNHLSIILFPALAGSFAILFVRHFLHTKEKTPVMDRFIVVFIIVYSLAVLARILGYDRISYRMIDFTGLIGAFFVLIIAIILSNRNFRPAKFFLIAWSIFLVGIVLFVLRNLNILPNNIYTNYTMQAGTALEVILLSFALADKINILTNEKEISQAQALKISLENQKIIKEQNIVLEEKVQERTTELTYTNTELESTLSRLKNTQSQLVDAEKMASLGQLTAGIAHEINNPINFVSSNIVPLKRDINDLLEIIKKYDELNDSTSMDEVKKLVTEVNNLKQELDVDYLKTEVEMLLNGMQDGAQRTVEIIRGLKVFSRIDESDLKYANINAGIQSTMIILNNQIGSRIKVIKQLGNLPDIECFAGKLNQVFMNIISNAIYAVQNNPDTKPPAIIVKSMMVDDQHVCVSIKDNGPGMSEDVKLKIYEPFFTTKEVGKGTGLGLSIVFQIIEMHSGKIEVNTALNEGTEFVITLPIIHSNNQKL